MDEETGVFMGSGNVFADLGLPHPEELQLKADLAIEIRQAIQDQKLSRKQAGEKMEIGKQGVDQIFNGRYFDYSVSDLVLFLSRLGRQVELFASVRERPVAEAQQTVAMGVTMPLHITTEQDFTMRQHAARDYPQECCGFLVGKMAPPGLGTGGVIVARVVPAANLRDDSPRNRFEIDPGELVKTDRAARAEGLGVVGFYHSHPDAPAQPSQFDREHAWPGYCYMIVSVRQGKPQEMRCWLLRDDRTGFDEDTIEEMSNA